MAAPTPTSSNGGTALAGLFSSSSGPFGLSEGRRRANGVTVLPGLPPVTGPPSRAPGAARRGRPRPAANRPLLALFGTPEPPASSGPAMLSTTSTAGRGSIAGSWGSTSSASSREKLLRDERATATKLAGRLCRFDHCGPRRRSTGPFTPWRATALDQPPAVIRTTAPAIRGRATGSPRASGCSQTAVPRAAGLPARAWPPARGP